MRFFIFFYMFQGPANIGYGRVPVVSKKGLFPHNESIIELIDEKNVFINNWIEMPEEDFLNFGGYESLEEFFEGK